MNNPGKWGTQTLIIGMNRKEMAILRERNRSKWVLYVFVELWSYPMIFGNIKGSISLS